MIVRIIKKTSFLILCIALISSILFIEFSTANAETTGFTPPENYIKDSSEMNFEQSKKSEEIKT